MYIKDEKSTLKKFSEITKWLNRYKASEKSEL